jgi:hypothetical protein
MTTKESGRGNGCKDAIADRRRGDLEFPEYIQIGHGKFARIRYRRTDVTRCAKAL